MTRWTGKMTIFQPSFIGIRNQKAFQFLKQAQVLSPTTAHPVKKWLGDWFWETISGLTRTTWEGFYFRFHPKTTMKNLPPNRHFSTKFLLVCQILKRGAPPLGGGEVVFTCPITKVALNAGRSWCDSYFFPGKMWRWTEEVPKKPENRWNIFQVFGVPDAFRCWNTSKFLELETHVEERATAVFNKRCDGTHCWWKTSWINWDASTALNSEITLSTGAGFLS